MTGDQRIRASDEDRSRTAGALSDHYAAGRLSLEEFHERLDRAYAATTLGQLDDLMADLPGTDLGRLPVPGDGRPAWPQRAPVQAPGGGPLAWPGAWWFWLAISLGVLTVLLVSGAVGAPWLVWVALPVGLVLLRRCFGASRL